jgi:catechol 2,3-dioxygenase-like lactoylglutathione lyase family enzyme
MNQAVLSSCAITFVVPNIEKTASYYHEVVGFRVVRHYENAEKFAALYRDAIEIVLIEAKFGSVQNNRETYGAGFDAYFVPETVEAVRTFYDELTANGAAIVDSLDMTGYGSSEFSFRDCDGRIIGVGRISDKNIFFANEK